MSADNTPRTSVTVKYSGEWNFTDSFEEHEKREGKVENIEEWARGMIDDFDYNEDVGDRISVEVMPVADAEYIENGGIKCPECKHQNVESSTLNTYEGGATQSMQCCSCGLEWNDVYTLTGIDRT